MVVISDVTQQLVDVDFYMHSLGEQLLKGISRPVEVFAVERPLVRRRPLRRGALPQGGLVGRDGPRRAVGCVGGESAGTEALPGTAFVVAGEAGIGKSRLVAEVVDRVEASAGRVLGLPACRTTPTSRSGPSPSSSSGWSAARLRRPIRSAASWRTSRRWALTLKPRHRSSAHFSGSPRRRNTQRHSWTRAPSSMRPSPVSSSGCRRSGGGPPTCSSSRTSTGPTLHARLLGPRRRRTPRRHPHLTTTRALVVPWRDAARPRARPPRPGGVHDPRRQPLQRKGTSTPSSAPPSSSRPKGSPLHRGAHPLLPRRGPHRRDALAPPGAVHVAAQGASSRPAGRPGCRDDRTGLRRRHGLRCRRGPHLVDEQLAVLTAEGVIERATRPLAPTASGTPSCVTRPTRPRCSTCGA